MAHYTFNDTVMVDGKWVRIIVVSNHKEHKYYTDGVYTHTRLIDEQPATGERNPKTSTNV